QTPPARPADPSHEVSARPGRASTGPTAHRRRVESPAGRRQGSGPARARGRERVSPAWRLSGRRRVSATDKEAVGRAAPGAWGPALQPASLARPRGPASYGTVSRTVSGWPGPWSRPTVSGNRPETLSFRPGRPSRPRRPPPVSGDTPGG